MLSLVTSQSLETPVQGLELVDRCRSGDRAAWYQLYTEHFDFAYRTARRLGCPDADVEDVVQEAFEVAHAKLEQFSTGRFSTWLYRIVANVVSARLRRHRVRGLFLSLWGASEPEASSLEEQVSARRQLQKLGDVLRALPREKREVFALFELEGLSHERIAELTGVKVETVRTRLHYARRDFEKLARKRGLL